MRNIIMATYTANGETTDPEPVSACGSPVLYPTLDLAAQSAQEMNDWHKQDNPWARQFRITAE
jgi:hypothetical protein